MKWRLLLFLALALLITACSAATPAPSGDMASTLQAAKDDLAAGSTDAAITRLEQAIRAGNKSADLYLVLGNAYVQKQDYAQAEAQFLKALEIQPSNLDARANLGVAYYQQAKLAEAEKAFRAVLAEKPNDAEWHYNLGGVLTALNRFDDAIKEFERAKELAPELPEPYLGLGSIYKLQGDRDKAIEALQEYLRLVPDNPTQSQWRAQAKQMLTELGAKP